MVIVPFPKAQYHCLPNMEDEHNICTHVSTNRMMAHPTSLGPRQRRCIEGTTMHVKHLIFLLHTFYAVTTMQKDFTLHVILKCSSLFQH